MKKKDGRDKKAYSEEKLKKQLRQVEEFIENQGKKISGFEDIKEGREEKRAPKTPRRQAEDPYRAPEVNPNSYEYRYSLTTSLPTSHFYCFLFV